MLFIAYIAAVFAALLNAVSSVVERWATNKPDATKLFGHHFAYEMIRSKLFLIGFVLQTLGFLAQALALRNGPLIVVEPLLTTDLIFLLVIIHWRIGVKVKKREWIAAAAIIGGLSGLFLATNPKEGHLNYQAHPWIILVSIVAPLIGAAAIVVRHLKSPRQRALIAASAAATAFALNAAFTKLSLNLLSKYGVATMFTSWPLFALIISGAISIYLMVNAYGSGPLAISQPILEVAEPAIAVTIGIMIFGDSYNSSAGALSVAFFCAMLIVGGIVLLGTSPRVQEAGDKGI